MTKDHQIYPNTDPVTVYCMICEREVRQVFDASKKLPHQRIYWRHVRPRTNPRP